MNHLSQCEGLSLAGPGSRAVGLDTRGFGGSVRDGGAVHNIVGVGERSLAHSANSLASTRPLSILLISGDVERNEEYKVRADDSHAREGSKLLTRALAGIGNPGPVGRGEVGVRSEIDERYMLC